MKLGWNIARRWRNLIRRSEFERDLSDELASFADLLTAENISRGMNPAAARRTSLLEIGGIEQVKEEVRAVSAARLCDSIAKDLRQSIGSLRRSMGSTLLVVGTLGLGLAATTLIFSVFYSVLLEPLPFRHPERLVQLWETRAGQGWEQASFTVANFWDVRARNKTFESMAALISSDMNLTGSGDPAHLSVGVVSAQFFHVLGVAPVAGHDFTPLQDQPGHDSYVALLSNTLWRSRFGSSREVVGTKIHLDGRPYTVIGVLPKGAPWLNGSDVFVPLVYSPNENRGSFEASVIGRLAPGVSINIAHDDLQRIANGLSRTYREDHGMGIRISPSAIWRARPVIRRALWVLLWAVTLLLLIACVNAANVLLARANARSRELRVREALGASRARLIRLLLTESVLLACLAAGAGLLVAFWGLAAVRAAHLSDLPQLSDVHLNGWVLAYTLVATSLAGIVSGLMPALHSSSGNIAAVLREGDRAQTAGRGQNRIRAVLVSVEVALSMILLIGAGLLIRSFANLLSVDRGFETAHRVIAAIDIPFNYDDATAEPITRALLNRTRALPGVKAAATVNSRPIVGWDPGMGFGAANPSHPSREVPWASWRFVSTDYFRAMGIPLLRGRRFTEADSHADARRVIISAAVAHFLWPGEDPIGRHILLWKGQANHNAEVIGVVGNIRDHGVDADPTRIVYIPFYGQASSSLHLVIDGSLSPAQAASSLRSILARIDSKTAVSEIQSMDALVGASLGAKQLNTVLLSLFAVVALLLAMSGIYGVLAYSVSRRTSEIGIRVALGADSRTILRLVLWQGMWPIAAGMLAGIAGSFALTRFLVSLLFNVKPIDPISYITVILLICVTALIACVIPIKRALAVDPVTALRDA